MVPKDKGWGMSNLGLWGKNPCVATLFVFPPSLVSPNRFDVLMEVVGAVIVLGVVWQDCQSFAHMPTPPMTFHSLHSTTTTHPHGFLFIPHRGLFSRTRIGRSIFVPPVGLLTLTQRKTVWFHPHAPAVILLDLTQPGEALLISGRSRVSIEWNRVCFPLCGGC